MMSIYKATTALSQSESYFRDVFQIDDDDAFIVEGTNRPGSGRLDITPADDKTSEGVKQRRGKLVRGQMVKTEEAMISFLVSILRNKPELFRRGLKIFGDRNETTPPEQPSLWTQLMKNVKSTIGFPDEESHLKKD